MDTNEIGSKKGMVYDAFYAEIEKDSKKETKGKKC